LRLLLKATAMPKGFDFIFANECYQLKGERKAEHANQIGVIDLPHLIENRGIILTK